MGCPGRRRLGLREFRLGRRLSRLVPPGWEALGFWWRCCSIVISRCTLRGAMLFSYLVPYVVAALTWRFMLSGILNY